MLLSSFIESVHLASCLICVHSLQMGRSVYRREVEIIYKCSKVPKDFQETLLKRRCSGSVTECSSTISKCWFDPRYIKCMQLCPWARCYTCLASSVSVPWGIESLFVSVNAEQWMQIIPWCNATWHVCISCALFGMHSPNQINT